VPAAGADMQSANVARIAAERKVAGAPRGMWCALPVKGVLPQAVPLCPRARAGTCARAGSLRPAFARSLPPWLPGMARQRCPRMSMCACHSSPVFCKGRIVRLAHSRAEHQMFVLEFPSAPPVVMRRHRRPIGQGQRRVQALRRLKQASYIHQHSIIDRQALLTLCTCQVEVRDNWCGPSLASSRHPILIPLRQQHCTRRISCSSGSLRGQVGRPEAPSV